MLDAAPQRWLSKSLMLIGFLAEITITAILVAVFLFERQTARENDHDIARALKKSGRRASVTLEHELIKLSFRENLDRNHTRGRKDRARVAPRATQTILQLRQPDFQDAVLPIPNSQP